MTVFVAVAGTAPGIGKSTVCTALAAWAAGRGLRVDHFREEEILTRAEFAAAADQFRAGGEIRLPTLLAAVAAYASSIAAAGTDVVVADALVPFVPSLVAWGHGEEAMGRFLADLARVLEPVHPVLLHLDGDPAATLARAAAREGPGWLDWYLDKLARPPGSTVHDLDTACDHLRRQRDLTLRLVRATPWPLLVVAHADRDPADRVARTARTLLGPYLP